MQTAYYKEYSRYLGREAEFKVYGTGGLPVLALPCRGGRFYDWEDRGMTGAAASLIDGGQIQLFCADSADGESFLAEGDARPRAEAAERWFCYLTREFYPRILTLNDGRPGRVLAAGTDLGAAHALRLQLRRPDLFCGVIALSGSYEGSRWFGEAADDLVLRCGCAELVRSGAADLSLLRSAWPKENDNGSRPAAPIFLCAGQGDWEEEALASTRAMAALLEQAGVKPQAEYWGQDVTHDWPWWRQQFALFAGRAVEQLKR